MLSFLEYPTAGRGVLRLTDTKTIDSELEKIQHGHSARLFTAEDIQDLAKEAENRIASIPKVDRQGLKMELYSDTFYGYGKTGYGANISKAILVWSKGEWRIEALVRGSTTQVRSKIEVQTTAQQVAVMVREFLTSNDIHWGKDTKEALTAPLEDMPAYLAGYNDDAEIAAARLTHGWDIKEAV